MVVMPFGLKNAPSHFQRSMNLLLADLLDVCVLVYMDDILIFSKSAEEHRQHVRQVFEHLNEKKLHVKQKKCALFLNEVEFLGHVVSSEGIKVAHDKIDAVKSWPTPETVRDIQAFLGLANFYRRFIKGFAGIARPLTDLTRKDVPFQWGDDQDAAFEALKNALTKAPILQIYDDELKHEVWVDASDYAVGATLVQEVSGSSG